jgi:hypothetical protein
MGREVLRLLLLAAASWPCSSFFAPAALGGAARGVALLSPRHAAPQRAGRSFALLVSASGAPRRPPPPPPPKKAAVGAGGASHAKVKDPQLQAGAWREDLGLGACGHRLRMCARRVCLLRHPRHLLARASATPSRDSHRAQGSIACRPP